MKRKKKRSKEKEEPLYWDEENKAVILNL